MTEAVTNLATNMQQYLLAESQQRAAIANSSAEVGATLSTSPGSPAITSAADAANLSSKNSKYQQDGQPGQKRTADSKTDTPQVSKSRSADEAVTIEIRDFDIGRTPAEVVGTADVLARFDDNQNGRVDLLESRRAAKARDSSSTFALPFDSCACCAPSAGDLLCCLALVWSLDPRARCAFGVGELLRWLVSSIDPRVRRGVSLRAPFLGDVLR